MAITTNSAHVSRALDFFNKNDIFFAIGKPTAWNEMDAPPDPTPEISDVSEVIGYKKAETIYMVVPDEVNGTISYRDSKWSVVPPAEAVSKAAKYVYIDTTLRSDELPLGYYRQLGIYSKLVPYKGRAQKTRLTITNTGALASGTLVLSIGGTEVNIAVDSADTPEQVVTNILSKAVNGWTINAGDTATEVIIECTTIGVQPALTYNPDVTLVNFTVDVLQEGTDAVSQKFNLLPTEVDDPGILEVIDNRGATNRLADQKEKLSLVIEF